MDQVKFKNVFKGCLPQFIFNGCKQKVKKRHYFLRIADNYSLAIQQHQNENK